VSSLKTKTAGRSDQNVSFNFRNKGAVSLVVKEKRSCTHGKKKEVFGDKEIPTLNHKDLFGGQAGPPPLAGKTVVQGEKKRLIVY